VLLRQRPPGVPAPAPAAGFRFSNGAVAFPHFRLGFASALNYAGPAVAKILPPIVVNGIRYRVLRLEGKGLRFLLRSKDGDLFGVYGRNAQVAMSAAPLVLKLTTDNPFRGVDFFETDEGGLMVGG